jgi:DNA-binding transcriptional MocR family regulator
VNGVSFLTRWQKAVARDPRLSSSEKALAAALASYMATDGGSCYPGVPRLSSDLGVSDRTVQRCRNELIRRGYLDVTEGGGSRTSRYRACLPVTPTSPVPPTSPGDDTGVTGVVTSVSPDRSRDLATNPARLSVASPSKSTVPPPALVALVDDLEDADDGTLAVLTATCGHLPEEAFERAHDALLRAQSRGVIEMTDAAWITGVLDNLATYVFTP